MSVRMRLFLSQLAALVVVAGIDVYANIHSLYWQYRWIDNPVHILGGVWVALACLWLCQVFGIKKPSLWLVLAAVLAAGITWEIYEYLFNISYYEGSYLLFDTTKDLIMDTVGGLIGWSIGKYLSTSREVEEQSYEQE